MRQRRAMLLIIVSKWNIFIHCLKIHYCGEHMLTSGKWTRKFDLRPTHKPVNFLLELRSSTKFHQNFDVWYLFEKYIVSILTKRALQLIYRNYNFRIRNVLLVNNRVLTIEIFEVIREKIHFHKQLCKVNKEQ